MPDEQDWVDVPAKKGAVTAVADDEWQDVAPAKAAPHASAVPSGSYQNRKGGPVLNANDSSAHAAVRGLEGTLGINKEPESFGDALGQSASSLGHLGWSIVKDPLNAGKAVEGIATGLEDAGRDVYQGLKHHDPRSVAHGTGAVAGILGPQMGGAKKAGLAGDSVSAAREAASRTLRAPEGGWKPGVTEAMDALKHPTEIPGRIVEAGLDSIVPERPQYPGASQPLAEDFYAQHGADLERRGRQQVILDKRPGEKPVDVNPGASQPLASDFYENRGNDLMARGRQQSILDRAAAKTRTTPFGEGMTSTSGTLPDTPLPSITEGMAPTEMPFVRSARAAAPESVSIFPEPHEPMLGDRPGAMWSVGRESVLPEAAGRGAPGAGDVLRNIGKPIIYTPREGVGYPGPKSITEDGSAAAAPAPPPSITEPPNYKQSEKAATMSAKPRDLGPEWSAGELQHEIQRNKSIIRNPRATAEDIAIAKDRLRDAQAMAAPKK